MMIDFDNGDRNGLPRRSRRVIGLATTSFELLWTPAVRYCVTGQGTVAFAIGHALRPSLIILFEQLIPVRCVTLLGFLWACTV
jgi:hypothetical protein